MDSQLWARNSHSLILMNCTVSLAISENRQDELNRVKCSSSQELLFLGCWKRTSLKINVEAKEWMPEKFYIEETSLQKGRPSSKGECEVGGIESPKAGLFEVSRQEEKVSSDSAWTNIEGSPGRGEWFCGLFSFHSRSPGKPLKHF